LSELTKLITKGVEVYNKTHSPEAKAKLLRINEVEGTFEVEFTGSFCETCGIRDWIEDLKYVLEDLNLKCELISFEEVSYGKYISKFKIMK